jgi:4-oxalocrotonate tautomerase
MPTIRIDMLEGRSIEQKRACAEAVTKALAETCGANPREVHVIFTDVARHDWASAGRLLSDPKPD